MATKSLSSKAFEICFFQADNLCHPKWQLKASFLRLLKSPVFNVFLWPRCQLEVSPRKVWYLFYVIQSGSYWSMIKDNHRWERGTIHEFDFSEQKISGRHQRATVWYCQQQDCCSSFTSTGSEVGTFLMKCLIPPEGSNSRKEKDLTSESWKWTLKSLIVIILQVTTPAT